MILYELFSIILGFQLVLLLITADESVNTISVLMPDAVANHVDDYLCTSFEMDKNQTTYITAFNPSVTSKDAHHVLLFGCTEPGSYNKIWNCGEMVDSDETLQETYDTGPACVTGSTIIYAWAMDAKKTELPKDVAFRVGGSSSIKYLVLQVHYANIDKFRAGQTDRSGLILTTSSIPTPKTAGVMLLATNGAMPPHSFEVFEVACKIKQDIFIHPFAFRTHAHKLGLVNSGYRVRGKGRNQEWTEIGRRSPQLPQMFYPTENDITIQNGDYVAAVCTMFNTKSHIVRIGSTSNDEMCNFYIMYWVDGDQLLDNNICTSPGPPSYYFGNDRHLNVENMPENAFLIPPPPNGPEPGESLQDGYHIMRPQSHKRRYQYRYMYKDYTSP